MSTQGEVTMDHDDGKVTIRLHGYDYPITLRAVHLVAGREEELARVTPLNSFFQISGAWAKPYSPKSNAQSCSLLTLSKNSRAVRMKMKRTIPFAWLTQTLQRIAAGWPSRDLDQLLTASSSR